eukprot:COSAG06_NODE_42713_length_379_cov_0.753571_1_plen_63_part_01
MYINRQYALLYTMSLDTFAQRLQFSDIPIDLPRINFLAIETCKKTGRPLFLEGFPMFVPSLLG